jgi:hypothetical protein
LLLDLPELRSSNSLSFHVATPQNIYIQNKKSHFTAIHNIVQNHLCLTYLSRSMCLEVFAFHVHFHQFVGMVTISTDKKNVMLKT